MATKKLAVAFGNVSCGDEVARISVRIAREKLTLEQADQFFCGRRLYGSILVRRGAADDDQESALPEAEEDALIEGVFDSPSIRMAPKFWSAGLSFKIDAKIEANLLRFAKRTGTLRISRAVTVEDETPSPIPAKGQRELKGVNGDE